MPEYDLHVMCPHCQAFHDAYVRVSVDDVFEVRRVSDIYKKIPPEFSRAASKVRCFEMNRLAGETDPKKMVLAEVGRWSARNKKPTP
jgi:hypothetical protein